LTTNSKKFDEEILLKYIQLCELSVKIAKLNWNWDYNSDSPKQAHKLMNEGQKLVLEISNYEQRMGFNINENQRNQIKTGIDEFLKLTPFLKNKIKHTESLEILV